MVGNITRWPKLRHGSQAHRLGSTFERDIGYSRAVAQGDWIFVSGTTGFDYTTMTIRRGVEAQAEQCLKNIETALKQAGSLADVVRVTYVLPDGGEFEEMLAGVEDTLVTFARRR
jgi:enamine deaminase RidA (YjgF/YER057c/UK114 family)